MTENTLSAKMHSFEEVDVEEEEAAEKHLYLASYIHPPLKQEHWVTGFLC